MAEASRISGPPPSNDARLASEVYVREGTPTAPLAPLAPGGRLGQQTNPHERVPGTSRGFATVLRNPYFLRLWMAQLISQTIMNAANYAMIILVNRTANNSLLATSGAIVAFSLPALFFGAPAGVLVDRFNRRQVLWVSNVLRAIASLGFVISIIVAPHAVVPIYLLTFFVAAIGQFFAPAEGAAIPLLVHREELINALSLFNITFTLAQAAGLIVIGPLVLLLLPTFHLGTLHHGLTVRPTMSLFVLIAALYLVCTVLILSIPARKMHVERPAGERRKRASRRDDLTVLDIWTGILECWQVIRRDRRLLISVLQLSLGGVVVAIVALIAPRFVIDFFHQPPELSVLVFVPAGAGLVLGSAFTPRITRRLRYTTTVTMGIVLLALSIALLTLTRAIAQVLDHSGWSSSWLYLLVMIALTFVVGVSLDFVNVPAQTLMQERSPDWVKGRVLAVQTIVLNGATVIFVPLIGLIADVYGLIFAIDLLAVLVASTGLTSVYFLVRGKRPTTDDRGETPTVATNRT